MELPPGREGRNALSRQNCVTIYRLARAQRKLFDERAGNQSATQPVSHDVTIDDSTLTLRARGTGRR